MVEPATDLAFEDLAGLRRCERIAFCVLCEASIPRRSSFNSSTTAGTSSRAGFRGRSSLASRAPSLVLSQLVFFEPDRDRRSVAES
jgi:hypothetical protein